MNSEQIRTKIDDLKAELAPGLSRLDGLCRDLDDALSREFIEANAITREDVVHSSGDGKPWFGTLHAFGDWLRDTNNTKTWCEWNGRLYLVNEVKRHEMRHNAPGKYEDVPA